MLLKDQTQDYDFLHRLIMRVVHDAVDANSYTASASLAISELDRLKDRAHLAMAVPHDDVRTVLTILAEKWRNEGLDLSNIDFALKVLPRQKQDLAEANLD